MPLGVVHVLSKEATSFIGAIPSITLTEKDYVAGTRPRAPTVTRAPRTVLFKRSLFDDRLEYDAVNQAYKVGDSLVPSATLLSKMMAPGCLRDPAQTRHGKKTTSLMVLGAMRHTATMCVLRGDQVEPHAAKILKADQAFANITEYISQYVTGRFKVVALDMPMLGEVGGTLFGAAAHCILLGSSGGEMVVEFKGGRPQGKKIIRTWVNSGCDPETYPATELGMHVFEVNLYVLCRQHMPDVAPGQVGARHLIVYGDPQNSRANVFEVPLIPQWKEWRHVWEVTLCTCGTEWEVRVSVTGFCYMRRGHLPVNANRSNAFHRSLRSMLLLKPIDFYVR